MKGVWLGLLVDLVPGVGAANSHENVVLASEVGDYVALSFAAVLATNQDIDQWQVFASVQTQVTCNANK